jgi:ArsR family transcriptional regulator, nickel/cobalt-responsive transcriptional repressor
MLKHMKDRPQTAGIASKLCADRLKALADEDRLRIVQSLRSGRKHVSQLAEELREDIANVSHHLQILRRCGLLQTERQGRFVVYSIHPDVFPATHEQSEHLDLGCCRLELPKA